MLTTTIYLPEELEQTIKTLAAKTGKPKAKIIREALKRGLQTLEKKSVSSSTIFRKLSTLKAKGPNDLATNHDAYGWD